MGMMKKLYHKGEKITVEKIEAEEIKVIAKENNGSFKDNFGIYFILTTNDNDQQLRTLSTPDFAITYIGRGGVIKTITKDSNTGKEIFSGAELCDLVIMPAYQRKGYASLITQLRLDWLKKQGYTEAFFPDCDNPEPVKGLFEKMQREGKIKFEKIYELANPEGITKSFYKVSNF